LGRSGLKYVRIGEQGRRECENTASSSVGAGTIALWFGIDIIYGCRENPILDVNPNLEPCIGEFFLVAVRGRLEHKLVE
jgi:hypothetical protein